MSAIADQSLGLAVAHQLPAYVHDVACVGVGADEWARLIRVEARGCQTYERLDDFGPVKPADPLDWIQLAEAVNSERELATLIPRLSHALGGRRDVGIGVIVRETDVAQQSLDALQQNGLMIRSVAPVGEPKRGWYAVNLISLHYNPFHHAQRLADAGEYHRAIQVLDGLNQGTELTLEQQAAVSSERLRHYRGHVESRPVDRSDGLPLFLAQKEFQIAAHVFPKRHALYRDHAAIWHAYGNDAMAARLLKSIQHVAPDDDTQSDLNRYAAEESSAREPETAPEWDGSTRSPRILVLTHDHSDYGMDTLYDGLCQVLGPENVVEYPWKPMLHGERPEATLNYPCAFNYPGARLSEGEIQQQVRDGRFDFAIYADVVQFKYRAEIQRFLAAAPGLPVVGYDTWDTGNNSRPTMEQYLCRPIELYFKREMLFGLDYGPNSYPLPFGYPNRHVPESVPVKRTEELFWAGKRLFGTRSLYLDYLQEALGLSFDRSYSQAEYADAIRNARIGLSFFGFGYDTVRYWELPANGCMSLAERPPVRIPFDFQDGISAVFFDDLSELERKLTYYLSHTEEADRIAAAGREWFLQYHTTSARARQFLGRVVELGKW